MATITDFRISIQKTGLDSYQVFADHPELGRAGPQPLDWSIFQEADPQWTLAEMRNALDADDPDCRCIGDMLFRSLFKGQILRLFTGVYDQKIQGQSDAYLRLRLDIDEQAPELAALPWELMVWRDVAMATQVHTLLTRQVLNLDYGAIKPLTVVGPIRVLIAIPGGSGLNTEREAAAVITALTRASVRYKLLSDNVSLLRLGEELANDDYAILHYIGHGAVDAGHGDGPRSFLRFNASDGRDTWVTEAQLQALLANHTSLHLVVLNACQSGTINQPAEAATRGFVGLVPSLLRAGIPAVIAMQEDVSDKMAIQFADTFYRRLSSGKWAGQVDVAITLARNACLLGFPDSFGFAIPVLYLRSPDGRIFDLPRQETAQVQARVFISYKRDVEPDQSLAQRLYSALVQAGQQVFIDQRMRIGVAWAQEIRNQIEACDYMLVLLSEASVDSEMVAKEVEFAHQNRLRSGRSQTLPVRVNHAAKLPYQLSHYLDHLQHAYWRTEADDGDLIRKLLEAITEAESLPPQGPAAQEQQVTQPLLPHAPQPYADPRFVDALREPSGAERLRSEFYIERSGDLVLRRELAKPYGTTTTIRAPRQTGKSSLLIRGISQAKAQGSQVALIDLQPVEESYLRDIDTFLRYFATVLVSKLRLDGSEVDRAWQSSLGASDKITYLMEDYVLPQIGGTVVLAIDEADRLLQTSFHDSFFGLLRFWHNSRAMNDIWERLDLVMVISTEPHLLIGDVTQSPFNVGEKIRLEDFDQAQVADLNKRYRSPLSGQQLESMMAFLDGHPYLTRKALYTLLVDGIEWHQLQEIGATDRSPFGDHLRRYLWLLQDQRPLRDALKQIMTRSRCPDEVIYYRLLQAGLIKGQSSHTCRMRCQLYQSYFTDRL